MRKSNILLPQHSEQFHCLGAECPDGCCSGWLVPVDRKTVDKYRALPPGPLRSILDTEIVPVESCKDYVLPPDSWAIRMRPGQHCPLLGEDQLCRIHRELGESYLCTTCATYPRVTTRIDKIPQIALTLSCPEAARLVLLDPAPPFVSSRFRAVWNDAPEKPHPLRYYFWPIREFAIALLLDRRYALWERMFLIGIVCQRLQAMASGEDPRSYPEFLLSFSVVLASGKLREAMEAIHPNPAVQLELVLRLLPLGTRSVERSPRLLEVIQDFCSGTDHPQASAESQNALYAQAFACHYEPFFRNHPSILENYLCNEAFRWLFPFGIAFGDPSLPPAFDKAFARLAIQFGILKGLLIGVAGCHGTAFSANHVIQAAQVVAKHFEHRENFLDEACALLAERGMAGIAGLIALLRN